MAATASTAAGPSVCPLWARAIKEQQESVGAGDSDNTARHVYVVGAHGSGKSALLARVLSALASRHQQLQTGGTFGGGGTAPLEYAFLRRAAGGCEGRPSLAHFWELTGGSGGSNGGGGSNEAAAAAALALARSENFFLLGSREVAAAAVVVVCLDLSAPQSLLPSLETWLGVVRAKLPKDAVDVNAGVSLVFAATKWDAFASARSAAEQRAVAGALRALAHSHGAHLFYLGGLGSTTAADLASASMANDAARQQQREAAVLDAFVRVIHHLALGGGAPQKRLKLPQAQFEGMLLVPRGADRLISIGWPPPTPAPSSSAAAASTVRQQPPTAADMAECVAEWCGAVAALFPTAAAAASAVGVAAGAASSDRGAAAAATAPAASLPPPPPAPQPAASAAAAAARLQRASSASGSSRPRGSTTAVK